MGIGVLGPLQVNGQLDGLAPRDRVVLEALVLHAGELVTADRIADALWREEPPATWSKVVQGSVSRLRKLLGPDAIRTADHGYRLVTRPGELDAGEFERLVTRAREQLSLGEPERASYTLGQALALWRGRPLADLDRWEPGRLEADRLEELRRDATELRIESALRTGRHREVLVEARRLVEEAPLRERRWELLALAQYRSGRQADALRTLHQLRQVLVEELGLDPGPEVTALEQAILRQDPSLLVDPASGAPATACPYPGLVAYDVADADGFFGRDADVTACLERLAQAGVLAVVGPSGSGKSSLVRAGVAARLQQDGTRVVVVTPGARPTDALSAVPRTGAPVALVVDQCEEAVALCTDRDEQARFFAALTAHAGTAPLVIAFRADRLGDLAAHADFARLVERGLYLLNPMSTDGLRTAIEGPARQAGLRLEAGLAELLVGEVEGRPGALPHLSHALRQTWECREGSVLTIEGYQSTGGIRNAVAQSAERLYDGLSADQQLMLRDLMLRLVTPGPEGEPVRGPVPRRLLTVDPEHDWLMEQLVGARLVTSDDGVVELAHEALARAWPRLRAWLDEDVEGQQMLRHLSVAADSWATMDRPDSELYRGVRLARAVDWRARTRPDLTATEREFLAAGERLAEHEEQTALQQARHQVRVNRRLRGLLAGAGFLLVVALVAGTLAAIQADRADEASVVADARRVATQSQLTDRVDRALRLAVAAYAVEPSPEARAGLRAALARSPQLFAFRPPGEHSFWHVDISDDGSTLAVMDTANKVRIYDPETLTLRGTYDPFPEGWEQQVGGSSQPVALSPDGGTLAVLVLNVQGRLIRLVDTETLREHAEQPGGFVPDSYANDVDISPDGRHLAVMSGLLGSPDSDLLVWDLRRPRRPLYRVELVGDTQFLEFSPDGSQLLVSPGWSSDEPPVIRVFDVVSGEQVRSLGERGWPFEVSPDSTTLAYAKGMDVVLVNLSNGRQRRLKGPEGDLRQVRFSADGRQVLALSDDRTVTVWDTGTGRTLERIALGPGLFADARFTADGSKLLAVVDGGLLAFDLEGELRYVRRVREPDPEQVPLGWKYRILSPSGDAIAASIWDPSIQDGRLDVRELPSGVRTPVRGRAWTGNAYRAASWSPDGTRLAIFERSGTIRIHDWRSGETLARRAMGESGELAYLSDDELLVKTGVGVQVHAAATLEPVGGPVSLRGQSIAIALPHPDGETAALLSSPVNGQNDWFAATRNWSLVDLGNGEVLTDGEVATSVVSAALSPDGERLAVAGFGAVEVVDLATGTIRSGADTDTEVETMGEHLTYSPDGALLVSTDMTGRVSLWDGHDGTRLGTVTPSTVQLVPVFLPTDDGRNRLLLAGVDGSLFEWDTSIDHAVDFACRVVGRGLNEAEWAMAFGSRPYQDVC